MILRNSQALAEAEPSAAGRDPVPGVPQELKSRTDSPHARRDEALDVLRGWAIILMTVSHVGARTRIAALAHLPRISAAEFFFFLSGIVNGMGSGARVRRGQRRLTYAKIARRGFKLWMVHVVLAVIALALHETTGRLDIPSIADVGGGVRAAWMILSLRLQGGDYLNILPLYIVFFALSPLVFELMLRRLTIPLLLGSCALWMVTQSHPTLIRFADPVCGPQVFAMTAWQFIFLQGLAAGYHREWLAGSFWPRHRRWALPLVVVVVSVIFLLLQIERPALGGFVTLGRWPWLFSKETLGPARWAIATGFIVLAYLALDKARLRLPAVLGWMNLMGQKGLYCFIMHLVFALAASAIGTVMWPSYAQEILTAATLVALYQLAKHDVLARYLPV
jgi:hypothetical protein